MPYTRQSPSPRYGYLSEQYRQLHRDGDPGVGIATHRMFPGHSLFKWVGRIRSLVRLTGARTLLDYGSGKGQQYDPLDAASQARLEGAETVLDYWGIDEVHCFDPNYEPYSRLPEGRFDGVVCTDVLEHCPEEDVDWILNEILGFGTRFVFGVVACYPAQKHLPDGSNAHCTIQLPDWWRERIEGAMRLLPLERYEFAFVTRESGALKNTFLTNVPS